MTRAIRQTRREFLASGGATVLGAAVARAPLAEPRKMASGEYLFAPGLTYLNTAALGPTPRRVVEETLRTWYELEANPSFHGYGRLKDAMEEVRAGAARLMGCAAQDVVVTNSTTDGMNTVAQGLALTAGQRVLTTDQEHPGGQMCWRHFARRSGITIDTVAIPFGEPDARSLVDRFAAAITRETRVISVSHVLSSTGLRMPVADLVRLAEAHGCLCVVDGAQAVGGIHVDLRTLGCHAYATSGHKWIMGPKGTGLLYLRPDPPLAIEPIVLEDGRGVYVESVGVRNIPGVLGLGVALAMLSEAGPAAVEARALALRNRLFTGLQGIRRLTVVSPGPGPLASPIVTFALPESVESGAFTAMLRERHRIVVKMVPKHWLNGIRVSTHVFNTEDEVDLLLRVLRAELA